MAPEEWETVFEDEGGSKYVENMGKYKSKIIASMREGLPKEM